MFHFSYLPGDSFMHRIDPISKFAWLMSIAFLGYIIINPIHQLILTVVIVVCALALANLPPKLFFSGFRLFLYFACMLFILQFLFAPPEGTHVYFHWGIINISQKSIQFALNLGIRVINIGSSALVFIMTTEPSRLVHSLITILRIPYRFAYAFYASIRYIPVFENEARNIMNAHAVRGAGIDHGVLARVRLLRRLTVPLLASGLRRAKNTAIAMEGRAFGVFPTRTLSVEYQVPRGGIFFSAAWWVVFAIYLVWVLNTTGFVKT